ncbi:hypothetical protein AND_004935 [Anopheles darlingi]|uniref:Uncharacterized protein n=1 Tax=Anopheles darlingi TaxID=43151 RepID=W5JH73_ANODA|nr:hypothetical protein AND_004935 [Anopheles darlingi]
MVRRRGDTGADAGGTLTRRFKLRAQTGGGSGGSAGRLAEGHIQQQQQQQQQQKQMQRSASGMREPFALQMQQN